jgi:CheY-like chemotaxis protein
MCVALRMAQSELREILVVANRTIGGSKLASHLQSLIAEDPKLRFYVLVPAVQSMTSWTATGVPEMGTLPVDWVELDAELRRGAQQRLDCLVEWLRAEGVQADGEIGSSAPLIAMDSVLKQRDCCEIVISSLPVGKSRWIRSDLSQRARRRFELPTTTVVSDGDEALPNHHEAAAQTPQQPTVDVVRVVLVGADERVREALTAVQTPTEVSDIDASSVADVLFVDFDELGSKAWPSLERAFATAKGNSAAVAVLTSEPNRLDWQRAHDAGAWAYLSKPMAQSELIWLLDTVLHEYHTLGTIGDLPR